MSQEIIKVVLSQRGDTDILTFSIKEDGETDYIVDLGSSTNSQIQLKRVFARLLEILIEKDISLKLEVEAGFSRTLQKEVSEEYINDLNNELAKVKEYISEQTATEGAADENSGTTEITSNW